MEPLRLFPLWYCPPGVARPDHCPHKAATALVAGAGPDGRGGTMWGGPYRPDTREQWRQTAGGWWINFTGKKPAHLMRAQTVPGRTVTGAEPDHLWVVPQALNADMTCAIPQRFAFMPDGSFGWVDEPKHASVIQRVRAARLGEIKEDAELIGLAVDLLGMNYHVAAEELGAVGWLSSDFLFRIIVAAGGGEAEGIL